MYNSITAHAYRCLMLLLDVKWMEQEMFRPLWKFNSSPIDYSDLYLDVVDAYMAKSYGVSFLVCSSLITTEPCCRCVIANGRTDWLH
jgi:hypothetical protein